MHNKQWEDLIPFYIAQTLSRAETRSFEQHAATCETCVQAIDDWRSIASAVRTEAASHMRDLPPLSPHLQALMRAEQHAGDSYPALIPLNKPRVVAARFSIPVTLVATITTVLLFGVLLVYLTLRDAPPDSDQAAPVIVAEKTATPTQAIYTLTPLITSRANANTVLATVIAPSVTPTSFMTNTPSRTPFTRTPTMTMTRVTPVPTDTPPAPPIPTVPVAIVMSETINLRAGPGTQYDVIRAARRDDRLTILAQTGGGTNLWYLVEDNRARQSWVFSGIVIVEPIDAVITPAVTIPAPPPTATPTATSTPTPTPTTAVLVTTGAWMHTATVVEHQCGGQLGVTSSLSLTLLPSFDQSAINITVPASSLTYTLFRTGALSYAGTYSALDQGEGSNITVTVQLTFDTLTSYTGQETVIHSNGCLVRSLWTGYAEP